MINLKLIETNFNEFNEKLKAKNVGDNVLSERKIRKIRA